MDAAPRTWRDRGAAAVGRLHSLAANPWLRLAFLTLSLLFLAFVLRAYWADMRSIRLELHRQWLVLSILALLPCLLFEVLLWRALLALLQYRLPVRRAAGLWFLSNLARYIPGNVWQFLGMMELGAESGVPRTAILASVAMHQVFSNGTGLLMGLPALAGATGIGTGTLTAILLALGAVAVLALNPWTLSRIGRLLTAVVRSQAGPVGLDTGRVLVILLGYCLYWVCLGTAFWALGRSLGSTTGPMSGWISAFPASYVAGYLSLLTPSGVGVREGVLALLLKPVAGEGLAGIAALAARLWLTAAELLAAAGALAANRSLIWATDRRSRR